MKTQLSRFAIYNTATSSYLVNRKTPKFEQEDALLLMPMLFDRAPDASTHMRWVEGALNLPDGQLITVTWNIGVVHEHTAGVLRRPG